MILHQHLQVNSEFFYAQQLDLTKFDTFIKTKIKFKKYSQDEFDTLIEDLVFQEKEQYIFIRTKDKGEFLLSSIHSKLSKDDAISYLKFNAKNQTCYLFDNVDYFSYGRFGIASNEKIERYLSFNSEPADDENIVEWIGKPHKWEYETHTFYTKKKLEDFEMFFDSDAVCEMAEYYLPFITDELDIKEIFVYSKEPIKYYKPKKSNKLTITNDNLEKIYNILQKYNFNFASVCINANNNAVIFSNYILRIITQSTPVSPTDKILSSNKMQFMWTTIKQFKANFLDTLVDMICDFENAQETNLISIRNNLLRIDDKLKESNVYYIHFMMKNKKKFKLILTSKKEEHNIEHKLGNKLNLKLIDKILKLMGLNIQEEKTH